MLKNYSSFAAVELIEFNMNWMENFSSSFRTNRYSIVVWSRIYLPEHVDCDFLIQLDSDMICLREFLNELLHEIQKDIDSTKLLFRVQDEATISGVDKRVFLYLKKYQVNLKYFINCGLMAMRICNDLTKELRKVINYYIEHPRISFQFQEQDALNQIFDINKKQILPRHFQSRRGIYHYHYHIFLHKQR
jgi:hypothetical protein